MAFSELEVARIERLIRPLCPEVPAHARDQLRYTHVIEGHSVIVYEERPRWNEPTEWIQSGVAKFRYFRSRNEWKLYWMRQDLKWHEYHPDLSTDESLEVLVNIVAEDQWGAFYG